MPGPILVRPPRAPEADLPKQGPLTTLDKLMTVGAALAGVNEPERSQFASDEDFQQAARYYMGGTLGQLMAPLAAALKIKAYHGSPHDFEQFSSAKIGTGEGAQAYGHGLYLAERPGVAESYKRANVPSTPKDDVAQYWLKQGKDDPARGVQLFRDYAKGALSESEMTEIEAAIHRAKGRMYEVHLHTSPDELLDWDAPLSQQPPKVQESARNLGPQVLEAMRDRAGVASVDQMTGEQFYEGLQRLHRKPGAFPEILIPDKPKPAAALQQAGIKGIRYFDQGSRGHGVRYYEPTKEWAATGPQGRDFFETKEAAQAWLEKQQTRNYVIFDDRIIEIAKKYGVTLAVAAEMYRRAAHPQMGDIGQ